MYIFLGAIITIICLVLFCIYYDKKELMEVTVKAQHEIQEKFYSLFSRNNMQYDYYNDVFDISLKIKDVLVVKVFGDYQMNVIYDIYINSELSTERNNVYFGLYEYTPKRELVSLENILDWEMKNCILNDIKNSINIYEDFSKLKK